MARGDVLLVGSVPLENAESVFAACGATVGDLVFGIPDGETGDRVIWVVYQAYRVFDGHPQLETTNRPQGTWIPTGFPDLWGFRIKEGVTNLRFDDLGYATAAEASYRQFQRLREEGAIPPGTRFQVSLPTPAGCDVFFREPGDLARFFPAYQDAMLREVDKLFAAIPASDVVLQWDVCDEVLEIEGGVFPWAPSGEEAFQRFVSMVEAIGPRVPGEALMGYHLCYADLGHQHMKDPVDLGVCVRMANAAVEHSGRRVDFFHMPVPRDRSDDAYFAPLADLRVGNAKIFLGLVHHTDGLEGSQKRLDTARRHLTTFGIATECGFGRRPAEQVQPLLELHRTLASQLHPTPA